jgi:hypothetical protein
LLGKELVWRGKVLIKKNMENWQPIETAPKEKNIEILGASAFRKTKAGHEIGGEIQIIRRAIDNWTGEIWIKRTGGQFNPTHWMPLPKAPTI